MYIAEAVYESNSQTKFKSYNILIFLFDFIELH